MAVQSEEVKPPGWYSTPRNLSIINVMTERARLYKKATRFALKRLAEEGCKFVTVDDGGEFEEWIDVKEKGQEEIIEDLTAVDQSQLLIETPEGKQKWIMFVYGNDTNEIICDYHTDPIIDKVSDEVYNRTY